MYRRGLGCKAITILAYHEPPHGLVRLSQPPDRLVAEVNGPILFGVTRYRWRDRVLDLEPMGNAAGAYGEPSRFDRFDTMPSQPSLQTCLPCRRKFRFLNRLGGRAMFRLVAKNEAAKLQCGSRTGEGYGTAFTGSRQIGGIDRTDSSPAGANVSPDSLTRDIFLERCRRDEVLLRER